MLVNNSMHEPEYFCEDWGFYIDIEQPRVIERIQKSNKYRKYLDTIHEETTSPNIPINTVKNSTISLLTKVSSTTFITAALTYFVFCIL